ncbi:MAG: deacetylase, partial [Acetanaerobacterium sp.]
DVSTQDWDPDVTAEEVLTYVDTNVTDGSIITMHILDNAKAQYVLEDMISMLRAKGYSFARLSDYIK